MAFFCGTNLDKEHELTNEMVRSAKQVLEQEITSISVIANLKLAIGCGFFEDIGYCIWVEAPPTSVTGRIASILSACIRDILAGASNAIDLDSKLRKQWIQDLYTWTLLSPCISEARLRDIPVTQHWYDSVPFVEFGYGRNRRQLLGPVSDADSGTSIMIGSSKIMGRTLLEQLNLPRPESRMANDFGEAHEAADLIGYPVVLKYPLGSNSVGVVTTINNSDHLRSSYDYLRRRFPTGPLLVEKMLGGHYFRVLVIDGRFIRASTGKPCQVLATGKETVRDLVESMQLSPEIFENVVDVLSYRLEGILLSQGLTLDSVPPAGTLVTLSPVTANWSDCSRQVHPLNIGRFEAIGRALGPSVLGIDVIAKELSSPLVQGRDGILEINSGPGFAFHEKPREVWRILLERLFPLGSHARIPIICFVAASEAAFVDSDRLRLFPLTDRFCGAASIAITQREFIEKGLPFDLCDAIVICGEIPAHFEMTLVDAIIPGGFVVTAPTYIFRNDTLHKLKVDGIQWIKATRA